MSGEQMDGAGACLMRTFNKNRDGLVAWQDQEKLVATASSGNVAEPVKIKGSEVYQNGSLRFRVWLQKCGGYYCLRLAIVKACETSVR